MRSFSDDNKPITGINITPLVDVVLVILVIFMAVAPLLHRRALRADIPKAAHGDLKPSAALNVRLGARKELFLAGRKLTPVELRQELGELVRTEPALRLIVTANQSVAYGEVVGLLDLARGAGVSKIGLEVRQK